MEKIQILTRKLIPPSSATPPHLQNLKVSSFDLFISPLFATCILYYPASASGHQVIDNAKRSEQLQKSLSEILAIYYPLAGRYVDEKHSIDCNDRGAEYLEAHVTGDLSEFIKRAELETELRNQLLPYTFQPPNSPLAAVQFNMFECGGVAIGVCVTHRIADGFTHFTFVHSWANACRLGIDKVSAAPNFELGSICPPRDLPADNTVPPSKEEKKIVMRSLVFKSAAISKLKTVATSNCKDPELLKQPVKGAEVVTALIWKALISVSAMKHGHLRPSVLVFPYNLRSKTRVLPENCCGNLVRLAVSEEFVPEDQDEEEVQLLDLIDHFRKTARKSYADCEKASNAEELFELTKDAVKELNDALSKEGEVDMFVFNNLHGFSMYQNDFGWGNPDWVQIAFNANEVVYLVDTKDGDGIQAWLSLEENKMLLFLKNLDIITFTGHGNHFNDIGERDTEINSNSSMDERRSKGRRCAL